jgi:hypothetical protein
MKSMRPSETYSASANRRSEDVRIVAVVVAELKFRDVQRQMFATYLVIAAHDTASAPPAHVTRWEPGGTDNPADAPVPALLLVRGIRPP